MNERVLVVLLQLGQRQDAACGARERVDEAPDELLHLAERQLSVDAEAREGFAYYFDLIDGQLALLVSALLPRLVCERDVHAPHDEVRRRFNVGRVLQPVPQTDWRVRPT